MISALHALRNLCLLQGHKDFLLIFSSTSFIVLGFKFQSMIHFMLNVMAFLPVFFYRLILNC